MSKHSKINNPIIEVFKTNISNSQQALKLKEKLIAEYPYLEINFDLEDCDKILRIESFSVNVKRIMDLGTEINIHIEVLED